MLNLPAVIPTNISEYFEARDENHILMPLYPAVRHFTGYAYDITVIGISLDDGSSSIQQCSFGSYFFKKRWGTGSRVERYDHDTVIRGLEERTLDAYGVIEIIGREGIEHSDKLLALLEKISSDKQYKAVIEFVKRHKAAVGRFR